MCGFLYRRRQSCFIRQTNFLVLQRKLHTPIYNSKLSIILSPICWYLCQCMFFCFPNPIRYVGTATPGAGVSSSSNNNNWVGAAPPAPQSEPRLGAASQQSYSSSQWRPSSQKGSGAAGGASACRKDEEILRQKDEVLEQCELLHY